MKLAGAAVIVALIAAGTTQAARLITGRQIKNGSIGLVDLSRSARQALKGSRGPAGPQGPQGAAGVPNAQVVASPDVPIGPGQTSYDVQQAGGPSLSAQCPAGETAVGTGFDASVGTIGFVEIFSGALVGAFVSNDSGIPIQVSVQAACVSSSGATAAFSGRSRFLAAERVANRRAHASQGQR